MRKALPWKVSVFIFSFIAFIPVSRAYADENSLSIIRQGLLGAATGAIASEVSGGKAGQGALIGAGTNVIGGALLNMLFGGGNTQQSAYTPPTYAPTNYAAQPQVVYVQPQPQPQPAYYYSQPQVVYYQPQPEPVYRPAPRPTYYYPQAVRQEDPNRRIIRQGLLGAATGALSAELSEGKAGKGALIGAGTNVIGGALLDTLFNS
jgi:hypothetical protein